MKRMFWLTIALGVLGIWAGFRAWSSPSLAMTFQAVAAIVIGGNLIFMTWVWNRAKPGSGDASVLRPQILLSVSMLAGLLPRLFWPAHETLLMVASITSLVLTIVVVIAVLRQTRRMIASRRR